MTEVKREVKPRNVYELRMDELFLIGTIDELAEKVEKTGAHIRRYISRPTANREVIKIGKEYPIYKMLNKSDGQLVYEGTSEEISEALGIPLANVGKYHPYWKRVATGEYQLVEDKVSDQLEVSKKQKMKSVKSVEVPQMDVYWSLMFRHMFRKWSGTHEHAGT